MKPEEIGPFLLLLWCGVKEKCVCRGCGGQTEGGEASDQEHSSCHRTAGHRRPPLVQREYCTARHHLEV